MPTVPKLDVPRYLRHATLYGGLRECWETARDELEPVELGKLAIELRQLKPRTAEPRFNLNRYETATLIQRLIHAGIADPEIRRYTGASQATVGVIRHQLDSRNASGQPGCSPSSAADGPGTAVNGRRPQDSQRCAWCSTPLPADLRSDAHYCAGGSCRQAAYRDQRKQTAA